MWNLDDIQKFITKLKTPYGVDCFCFDFQLNCFDEFQVSKKANFYIEVSIRPFLLSVMTYRKKL